MHEHRLTDRNWLQAWIRCAVVSVLVVLVTDGPATGLGPDAALGGEVLYNGICLPSHWPPTIRHFSREPMPVPYLLSLPQGVPIDVGRQLFVDDFLIERTTLKRSYHKAAIHPASPVLVPDKPWEKTKANTHRPFEDPPVAMPFSDGVWYDPKDQSYKMWYMAGYGISCTCYATSKDGLHWTKPSLDVVPNTNIVQQGTRDSAVVWLDHGVKDPQRRFKLVRRNNKSGKFEVHLSADGIHWSERITWTGSAQDRSTFFYNPFRGVWVFSLRSGGYYPAIETADEEFKQPDGKADYLPLLRHRRYAEGQDFLKAARSWPHTGGWQECSPKSVPNVPTMWTRADRLDRVRADTGNTQPQLYNLDAVAYESVMLGLFSIWRGRTKDYARRDKINEVCVGFSRDGFHWHRPMREAFVGVSENPRDWNYSNVQSVGGGCLVVRDKLYFYVGGRNTRDTNRCKGEDAKGAHCNAGLAVLRRDGFASMDAGTAEGTLTTRPLRFTGKHLFANVNAPQGEFRAEVLGASGEVIGPFSRSNCAPVKTDSTLQRVSWKGAEDLSKLSGTPVRFRFYLTNGRLYAFWVSADRNGASNGYVAAGGPGFTGPTDTVGARALR